jgi:hypothetical protein
MFRLYGNTLEPEELVDFDFPGKIAAVEAELDTIITVEPIFAKYGITNFEEYTYWMNTARVDDTVQEDWLIMRSALNDGNDSPEIRKQYLRRLKEKYTDYSIWLETIIQHDSRPVVVRAAETLLATGNSSLINEYLTGQFSTYAATAGFFIVIVVIIFVMPLVAIDRSGKINYLQYSSAVGRKIMRFQFSATITGAFILSAVLTALSFAPFLALAGGYWNTSIMVNSIQGVWLYNITFGQYVFILAGMIIASCAGAACVAFILSRFSVNLTAVMVKAIPAGVAFAAAAATAVSMALSANNIVFTQVFQGRINAPEVIVCGVIGVVGVMAATVVAVREKERELL